MGDDNKLAFYSHSTKGLFQLQKQRNDAKQLSTLTTVREATGKENISVSEGNNFRVEPAVNSKRSKDIKYSSGQLNPIAKNAGISDITDATMAIRYITDDITVTEAITNAVDVIDYFLFWLSDDYLDGNGVQEFGIRRKLYEHITNMDAVDIMDHFRFRLPDDYSDGKFDVQELVIRRKLKQMDAIPIDQLKVFQTNLKIEVLSSVRKSMYEDITDISYTFLEQLFETKKPDRSLKWMPHMPAHFPPLQTLSEETQYLLQKFTDSGLDSGEIVTMAKQFIAEKPDLVPQSRFMSQKELTAIVEQLMQYSEKHKLSTVNRDSFAIYLWESSIILEHYPQHYFAEKNKLLPMYAHILTTYQEGFDLLPSQLDALQLLYELIFPQFHNAVQIIDPWQLPGSPGLLPGSPGLLPGSPGLLPAACRPLNAVNGVLLFPGNGGNGDHPNGKSIIVKFKIPKDNFNSFDDEINELSGSNPDEEEPPQEGILFDGIPPDNTQSSEGHHSKGDAHASVSLPPDSPDKLARSGEEQMGSLSAVVISPPDHYNAGSCNTDPKFSSLNEVDKSKDGLNDLSGSNSEQPPQEGIPFGGTPPDNTQSSEGHHSKGDAHVSVSLPPDSINSPDKSKGAGEDEQMNNLSVMEAVAASSPDHYTDVLSDPKFLSQDELNEVTSGQKLILNVDANSELGSILYNIQMQFEAMNYEEMKYMLTKLASLAKSDDDSAVILFAEGLANFMLKDYEESFEKFREAEIILQKLLRSEDSSVCFMYMGDAESNQGHYKSAPEYFERAIASHQRHSQPSQLEEFFNLERTTLSTMLSKHALSLRNDDRVVDSERRYKQAMSCPDATPSDTIVAHTGLGNLLHSLGSNEKAVPEYLAAIDIAEREKDYLSLAWAHGNLGNTYLSLGKREKGLSHLQTSLDLTLEHDFDPSSISRALNNLGTAYQSLNELDKAELYFDQALSQAIYANDMVGQARAYGNIGNVYMLLKDFLKSIPHYTEVLRLSRDRSTVYVAYHNRGCALFELAEKKKGEQYQFTKRGEFQFIAIGPDTSDMDYKHQPDEELDDHTTELYQQSLKDLRKVIKNVESTFSNSSSSTIGLDLYLSLFHINAKTFQKAQDCAFNLRDHYLSLTIAEQVRARTLGELLLKRKSHQLPTTFSTPLNIDAIKLAVELLPDPYTPVVVLSYTGTRLLVWVLVFDGKMVSVNSFEQEPDEELFGKQLDTYLRYELADDLTGNIDLYGEEEEKEVEFEEEGEKTDEEKEIESDDEKKQESDEEEKKENAEKYSNNNMDSNKLDDIEILEKATEPVKKEKEDKKSGPARKRKILSDLYKMIAKPLEAILKAVIPEPILHSRGPHKLILIPDNSTKMIPFNALLNEEKGVYFGDRHTLQFFPSLLCLGIMSQAPPTVIRINGNTTGDVLIVGDPSTPAFKFEGEDWTPGPLPHAKKEAKWVGHYMGTSPLLGGEPTKEVVLAKLSQAKLIHLATHGSATYGFVLLAGHCYDRQTTFTSSLRYHEDEKKLLLYASEIESLRLQSCLVILSSCDSGRGKFKGDEIQGMSRSFLLAGAAAVMTSLWKVPDQSASYFMQYFYRYLLDGHTSSVSLQKSIQSIRSIHQFSQVIHWGGYQLTGSDVRIVVEVSDQDRMVFKALGCPGGVSPFPRLELLQQLENNLLSSTDNNVQIIYGPCGTDPAETVEDFIAKHHSSYQSIYWCNACHPVVMNNVIKIMEKAVCDYDDHQSSMLLVVDSAAVDNVADLIPLSCRKNIQIILVAQSTLDYKEMVKEVDIKLKMGVSSLPAVKPLTELECAQRIVYSLVRNEENDINCYNSKDINSLASLCSGSPLVVKMAERIAAAGKAALKIEDDEDELDVELKSCHKEVIVVNLSQSKNEAKEYLSSLHISSVIDKLCLSPVSRILLNCVSVFHGVPIPKLFLSSLENEIINASSSSSSDSPLSSLSLSSLSSSHSTAIDCVAELLTCQCIVSYPSPVIVQSSSAKVASSIDTTLYTVPDIISECIWSNMETVDKLFTIGIAYRTIKRKAKNIAVYSHGLANQLLERFEDIENGLFSGVDFDEKDIQEMKDDCYILLLSLKELFRTK